MAVDDDIDALEEELEGLDGDNDGGRRSQIVRFLPAILPAGALVILLIVVFFAYSGGEQEETMIIQDLATAPGAIKIEPESGGAPVPIEGQDNAAYNPMNQGSDDTQVAKITPPPEEPMKPEEGGVIKIPPPEAPPAAGAEGQAPAPAAPEGQAVAPAAPEGQATVPAAPEGQAMAPAESEAGKTEGAKPAKPENLVAGAADEPAAMPEAAAAPEAAVAAKQPEAAEGAKTKVPEPETQTAHAGTVVKPPAAKKTPPPPAPSTSSGTTAFRTMAGVYRVQIASAKSEGLAHREWKAQVSKYPDVLSNLSLTVQRAVVKDRGTFYRVQGGPFQDRGAADSVCRKLKSRGQDCLVVRP